jgi:hypothetical protein
MVGSLLFAVPASPADGGVDAEDEASGLEGGVGGGVARQYVIAGQCISQDGCGIHISFLVRPRPCVSLRSRFSRPFRCWSRIAARGSVTRL